MCIENAGEMLEKCLILLEKCLICFHLLGDLLKQGLTPEEVVVVHFMYMYIPVTCT